MSIPAQGPYFAVVSDHRDLLRAAGLNAARDVFADPRLQVWRDLPERDNSTLDIEYRQKVVRLHIKRDKTQRANPVDAESRGILLLEHKGISSAPLVASGRLDDGRSCLVTLNLDGYKSADRLLEEGSRFADLLAPTLDIVVRLHRAGLHHRDLYLNHFYVRRCGDTAGPPIRLIDAARVRPLPVFFRTRWVVKDLAQFMFSLGQAGVPRDKQEAWLSRYTASTRGFHLPPRVWGKVHQIVRHDRRLAQRQPDRNVRLTDGH